MFSVPPELQDFQARVRAFARQHIAPVAAVIDESAQYPEEIHRFLVSEGYMRTAAMPESGPLRFLRRAILIEEVAYASAAVSMIPMVNELGCTPIQLFGNPEQKSELLGGVADGSLFASYGLTEPQAGSDVAALACTAEPAGKEWVISGNKSWICNVRQPGFCVVFARSSGGNAREALTAFIVPTDSPGFEVINAEPTLGLRGSPTYNFLLKEVPLTRDGDFSWDLFIERYNANLANDWGNLFTRSVSMIHRYRAGLLANPAAGSELGALIRKALADYREAMDRYAVDEGIEAAWTIIRRANQMVEEGAPWKLAKDPAKAGELDALLGELAVALQHTAFLLFPIMPSKARLVWETLRLSPAIEAGRFPADGALLPPPPSGVALGESQPLFPRIEK